MAEPLGKIEKPEAKEFASKRKLYLVPLIFSGKKAPEDYAAKYHRYWQQVSEYVANLEKSSARWDASIMNRSIRRARKGLRQWKN